jgi:dienelactone hydrolase
MKTALLNEREVVVSAGAAKLMGCLTIPKGASGIVLFAHGSGSSRHSQGNIFVARTLNQAGLATLRFDLLTAREERIDSVTAELRFDIELLAGRLVAVTDWLAEHRETAGLRVGYFGASTGAAAALVAAAERQDEVCAVVSRGGRPDLAGEALSQVRAPTLLIVGGHDDDVILLNERAFSQLRCTTKLEIVPGATHLFAEEGALERVAELARQWFDLYLLTPFQ